MFSKLIVFSALFAAALAECPGDTPCSGHGKCGRFDKCECYRNWQGRHCGDRTCPFQTSWNQVNTVTLSTGVEYEHAYTECSSKGLCDRKSGQCGCFDGFTGSACRRMKCEGDGKCGGHGVCKSIDTVSSSAYTGWDATKIQQCVCDPGYEGDSCSAKICPHGDDPLTSSTWQASGSWANQVDNIQELKIEVAAPATADQILLSYEDYRNKHWYTSSLDAKTLTPIVIKEALEALPNHAVPQVTVTGSLDSTSFLGTFEITFSHHSNSGKQPLLRVLTEGCSTPGCQPKYAGIGVSTTTYTVAHVLIADEAFEEYSPCSQRGQCDTEKGDCVCFRGYTGQACETQTIIV